MNTAATPTVGNCSVWFEARRTALESVYRGSSRCRSPATSVCLRVASCEPYGACIAAPLPLPRMAWRVTARRPRRMSAGQYAAWGSGRIQRLAAHRASFISGAVLWSRAVGSRRPYGCTHAAFCTPRLACPIIAYLPVCVPRRCVLHTDRRRRNLESMVRRAACAADRVAPVPASGTPRYSRLYCLPPTSALSRPAGFGRSGYCGSVGFEHSRQFRSTKSQPAPLHTHPSTRPRALVRACRAPANEHA